MKRAVKRYIIAFGVVVACYALYSSTSQSFDKVMEDSRKLRRLSFLPDPSDLVYQLTAR